METKNVPITHAVRLENWRVQLHLKWSIIFNHNISGRSDDSNIMASTCWCCHPKDGRDQPKSGEVCLNLEPQKTPLSYRPRTTHGSLTMFISRQAALLLLRATRSKISISTRYIRARPLPTIQVLTSTITKSSHSRFYSQDAPKPSKFYSFQEVLLSSAFHSLNLLTDLRSKPSFARPLQTPF